ncbi:hypothetical protein AABB24_038921 [Solanum stoloniferum]|uniref:Neprosin PEP catalytic domain-containing protein n=1 Tax=Solanum stoloniferum TaxID=62892 RepID=A0ABD2QZX0_9SOLN
MVFKFIAILLLEIITFATFVWGENGLVIKSIQSEDGDVIDYIDIFKQPALYHRPALKNHKIQMAILLTEGYRYVGGKTDMIARNTHVEEDDEYSTSRLTLKSGSYYNYQDIESGWTVNPRVYGDRQTRLFTCWTNDGSRETGCFDLSCPGFVQISHEIALGAAIYPISTQYGLPYSITIYIYKDFNTSNWWLQYGGSINIGYWPSKIFEGGLEVHAETVQWGGEVYSKNVGKHPHTKTQMGSGAFPFYIFANTGFMKYMRILDNTMELRFPQNAVAYSEEYDCYRTQYVGDYIEEPEFQFGGPGRNPLCP